MKAPLFNLKNEQVGETEIPENIFGAAWRPALVHQVVTAYLANLRRPWAHAKGRAEVRGGGRKPWRQKGTGRARHGSIRSPLWRGGGKAHGPNKEKDYSQKVNKKMKRVALFAVLSKKFKDGEVRLFDKLEIESPKTKVLAASLKELVQLKKKAKKYDVLLVADSEAKNIFRAASNLSKVLAVKPESLNVYEVLNHKKVFIDQRAVPVIEKHYRLR